MVFLSRLRRDPRTDGGQLASPFVPGTRWTLEADLLADAMRYAAAQAGKDQTYTKHPTTWLNGKCWLDEPVSAAVRPHSYLDSIRAGLAVYLDEEGA